MNNSIHYRTCGQGKPLVLVHGWTMDSRVWSAFIEEFSPDYTIIAVDLRGHGASGRMPGPYTISCFAHDLEELMENLALRDVTVIGWSMGVSTILKMFDHVVSRVDSLVFISGTPSLVARDDYRHGLPQAEVSSLLRAIKKNYLPGMERFYRLMFQGEDLQHPQRETITALAADTVRAPRQDVACESLQSMLQEDLRAQVKNIPVPALLIHGRLDRICLPEASQYMAERLANACLRIVESTGHVPFLTAADEVHREVRRFIRSWQ